MKNLNRRRFVLNKNNIFIIFLLIAILFCSYFIYYKNQYVLSSLNITLQTFSNNFDYQYKNLNIIGLERVEKKYLEEKLNKYLNTSIFLLPLNEIRNSIKQNSWVKNVSLKTNYKDTLFIKIEEYKPLGIYSFNNKFFFFDIKGKIIEENNKKISDDSFIIFKGQSSNLHANSIIKILKSLNFQKKLEIKYIEFLNDRRWDIYLSNNVRLMLSEEFPKKSIENFIKILNNLSETDLNNIKSFDLRDVNKIFLINK